MIRAFLILALILGGVACGPGARQTSPPPKKPTPVQVQVARAETRLLDRAISVTGSLLADETLTVVSEVAGKLESVRFDFGQNVRKGDVLAQIERTEYELQLARSKAALAQALARLGLDPAQAQQKPETTPAMRQMLAQLEDARFKFENAKKLVATGDISRERFSELEKAYQARLAAYEATQDEMRTGWASVEALRAEVRLAEKRLADTTIRAPFDATVSERKAAAGQYIKENTPILTMVKAHPLRLRLEVPETASGVVRPGTALEFTTDAVPGAQFRATVQHLNPAINEQSRMLVVEARLSSPDPRLRPGMFAQVRLILERGVAAVMVPQQAVYSVAGLTKVFVVRGGKVVECRVPPGRVVDGLMEVPSEAIRQGEQVVVGNLAQLIDGQEVQIAAARS